MVAIDTWHDAKWRQTPFAFIQMMTSLSLSRSRSRSRSLSLSLYLKFIKIHTAIL